MNPSLLLIPDRYKAAKLYSQIPDSGAGDLTFARNSNATRVNSAGLIEKVRRNVFTHSQALANAAWQTLSDGGAITKTANAGTAPDGTNTATRIQIGGGGTYSLVFQDAVNPLGLVVISGFFKRFGGTNQTFRLFGDNGNALSSTLTATDTWQRFSYVMNASSTGADGLAADASNNAYDILVWGMQLETGDIATPYIPTTTAAVSVGITADIPRLDYTGGGCPSLLLEPQRTNLALFSEQFDNAYWRNNGIVSVAPNNTTSPSGDMTADFIAEVAVNNIHYLDTQAGFSVTNGVAYTFSVFAKYNGRFFNFVTNPGGFASSIGGTFDLQNGAVFATIGGSASIENYGNGWYRCIISGTATSTTTTNINLALSNDGSLYPSYLGDITKGVFVWGIQQEAGSYPTSYIPTLGSSVTRLADAASKTGISSLIGQTAGTIYFEVQVENGFGFQLGNSTSGSDFINSIQIAITPSSTNAGSHVAGVAQVNNASAGRTGRQKVALAYALNDYAMYINGSQIFTDTTALVPLTSAIIFNHPDLGTVNGKVIASGLYATRLSNAELASLTTL
jgi:hypothetical protein